MFNLLGKRKFYSMIIYMACCTVLDWHAISTISQVDLMGLGILNTGMATGLGAFVYGNVGEHKAKNGGAT